MHNTTWLTLILLFVGVYYLFLFIVSLGVKETYVDPDVNYFYFLIIPAKNEEKVIKSTLDSCLNLKGDNYRILVVDDNSDDNTTKIVLNIASENKKVVLLTNPPGQLKKGKGAVLNFAYKQIQTALKTDFLQPLNLDKEFSKKFDKDRIVIGVFDADAHPSSNMLKEVSKVIYNNKVDAVQTTVRISNRFQSLLSRMQDVEFLGFSRVIQKARSRFGSVGLGGNGQFTKLSALEEIGDIPWGDTLTEDLELGLRLIIKGKRLFFTDKAIVEQEGVISLRAILKQRTRWLQGHFMNWKYLPGILTANIPLKTKLDTTVYIVFVSVVFLVGLSLLISLLSFLKVIFIRNEILEIFYDKSYLLGTISLFVYSFVFIPMFIYSVFKYYKEETLIAKFSYIFLFAFYTYIWLPAGITAIYRIITGRTQWVKTGRVTLDGIEEITATANIRSFRESERRKWPRRVYLTYASINNEDNAFIKDISKGGIKITCPASAIKNEDSFCMDIPGVGKKRAKVVWYNKNSENTLEAGLQFV